MICLKINIRSIWWSVYSAQDLLLKIWCSFPPLHIFPPPSLPPALSLSPSLFLSSLFLSPSLKQSNNHLFWHVNCLLPTCDLPRYPNAILPEAGSLSAELYIIIMWWVMDNSWTMVANTCGVWYLLCGILSMWCACAIHACTCIHTCTHGVQFVHNYTINVYRMGFMLYSMQYTVLIVFPTCMYMYMYL